MNLSKEFEKKFRKKKSRKLNKDWKNADCLQVLVDELIEKRIITDKELEQKANSGHRHPNFIRR